MTSTKPTTPSTPSGTGSDAEPQAGKGLDKLRALIERRKAERQKVIDSRYPELVESRTETEEERFDRIYNDPSAWQ